MRVLICGGRNYGNREIVERILGLVFGVEQELDVVHTGAKGAAAFAKAWAMGMRAKGERVTERGFRVDAPRVNPTAERIAAAVADRCRRLFLEAKPDLVFHFPADPTEVRTDQDLVDEAKARKILLREIEWSECLRKRPLTRAEGCYDDGICIECKSRVRSTKPGGRCTAWGYGGGDRLAGGVLGCMPPRCADCEAMDNWKKPKERHK